MDSLRRVPYGAWMDRLGEKGRPMGEPFFGLAEELTEGGMRLRADEGYESGDKLQLVLLVENSSTVVEMEAEVLDREPGESLPVRFVNVDPDDHIFLSELAAEGL